MAETLGPSRWNWINAAGRAAAGAGQKNQRVELAGPNGFLNQLIKNVLETGACGDDRARYDGHDPAGRGRATRVTALELRRCCPRSARSRSQRPLTRIVRSSRRSSRGQRRLTEIDEIVLPLTAKGLTIGEVAAHVAEVYGGDGVQGRHVPDHRQGEG